LKIDDHRPNTTLELGSANPFVRTVLDAEADEAGR
jgi:hypothetical protein